MNIFRLDTNARRTAQFHCDKHVVKMILETAQMLSTAHRLAGNDNPILYRSTHINHPCNIWVRESKWNYSWTYRLFYFLCAEYTHRYDKIHKTETKLRNVLLDYPSNIIHSDPTPFRPAIGRELTKGESPIIAYRDYYRSKKNTMKMVWTNREIPDWFNE